MPYIFINNKNNEYENILGICVKLIQKSSLQQTHLKIFARYNSLKIKTLIYRINTQNLFPTLNGELKFCLKIPQLPRGIWMISDNDWSLKCWESLVFLSINTWSVSVAHVPVAWMFDRYPYFSEMLTNQKLHNKCICHNPLCARSEGKNLCLVYGYRI